MTDTRETTGTRPHPDTPPDDTDATVDLPAAIATHLTGLTGTVIEVGGDPDTVRALRAAHLDVLSLAAPGTRAGAHADPEALPLRTGSVAAIVATHRLPAVDDVDTTLAGFARVLAPGGRVVIAANALGDRRELRGLWTTAARDCGVTDPPPFLDTDARFPLDHAEAWLQRHFTDVTVTPLRGTTTLDADTVLALLRAQRPTDAGVTWDLLASVVESRVRDTATTDGGFALTTLTGIATGTK
ncbi:methyltransferase domain-containing protein [Actinokineospora auranticolor]|uniref:Methyltransferase family protein n=1 Tax=Actinokineospora auranticolor TaxID=155976 RepID=A0A2S6GCQ7_9PSEU|nr:methyltransferase domain-containing protein [Actinokineospora auranticolor]PPK62774.1 methyltransferase family protein [Actinokineospora auranticolor]